MEFIEQSWKWIDKPVNACPRIEYAARHCYQSHGQSHSHDPIKFVEMLIRRGHETPIEHVSATVLIETDRGVTHELVRHRLASYSQESTRYCDYSGDLRFIRPVWLLDDDTYEARDIWYCHCEETGIAYSKLRAAGWSPQQARTVLNNSVSAKIVMTANLREWRHIFKLRTSKAAHPQMRHLMIDMLHEFKNAIPVIFDDIGDDVDD